MNAIAAMLGDLSHEEQQAVLVRVLSECEDVVRADGNRVLADKLMGAIMGIVTAIPSMPIPGPGCPR